MRREGSSGCDRHHNPGPPPFLPHHFPPLGSPTPDLPDQQRRDPGPDTPRQRRQHHCPWSDSLSAAVSLFCRGDCGGRLDPGRPPGRCLSHVDPFLCSLSVWKGYGRPPRHGPSCTPPLLPPPPGDRPGHPRCPHGRPGIPLSRPPTQRSTHDPCPHPCLSRTLIYRSRPCPLHPPPRPPHHPSIRSIRPI